MSRSHLLCWVSVPRRHVFIVVLGRKAANVSILVSLKAVSPQPSTHTKHNHFISHLRGKPGIRGVRLAKKITLVRFCKKLRFSVRFQFYEINRGFVFGSVFCTVCCLMCMMLEITYFWIGPANCQLKWLRTRSAEIQHEEKYFDCWSYHVARWTVNETMWKTVPKPPKSFFGNRTAETVFGFWILRSVRFGF